MKELEAEKRLKGHKIAIMQPYLFPYIGYWQLMNLVDTYVILDDVNYINRGWINRNRILINGTPSYFTLPLKGASQNRYINELMIHDRQRSVEAILKTIRFNYSRSRYFDEVYELLLDIFDYDQDELIGLLKRSIEKLSAYLDMDTEFMLSSKARDKEGLAAQDMIIHSCKELGADIYINPIGGTELYDREAFNRADMELYFIRSFFREYPQASKEFIPGLSIIDVLMNNGWDETIDMLKDFDLI